MCGCGSVGRAVASYARGLQFESSHRKKIRMFTVTCFEKIVFFIFTQIVGLLTSVRTNTAIFNASSGALDLISSCFGQMTECCWLWCWSTIIVGPVITTRVVVWIKLYF